MLLETVARIGAGLLAVVIDIERRDEFVIVLWRVGEMAVVERVCNKIHEALRKPLACLAELGGARDATVDASLGAAFYPGDGQTADALIKHADLGMDLDKSGARGAKP